jgi:hypothetical protein
LRHLGRLVFSLVLLLLLIGPLLLLMVMDSAGCPRYNGRRGRRPHQTTSPYSSSHHDNLR